MTRENDVRILLPIFFMIIDTHAHLMFEEFDADREAVAKAALAAGVWKIVGVGCGVDSSARAVEMAAQHDFLYATVGLHPYDADQVNEELMARWEAEIGANPRIVAVGETGLDYFKSKVAPEQQKKSFLRHLELAEKVGRPVIVHNREADEDCLECLQKFPDVKAVFHCYGSDLAFAKRVWAAGYLTSFTGIITFNSAEGLREVVAEAPLDKMMVETDCPYLAPQAHRGERNEPKYVLEVVKKIAELRGMSFEEVAEVTTKNAESFFQFPG